MYGLGVQDRQVLDGDVDSPLPLFESQMLLGYFVLSN